MRIGLQYGLYLGASPSAREMSAWTAAVVLALALAAPAGAQPVWRAAGSYGLTRADASALSLGAERSFGGLVAAGGRVSIYTSEGGIRDGMTAQGGAFESLGSVRVAAGPLVVRGVVSGGVSSLTRGTVVMNTETRREAITRLFSSAGLSADVWLTAQVGVGVEARRVFSDGEPDLSEVSGGVRIRFDITGFDRRR